ncbi:MAG: site-specific integrase [Planctomycetes bacterium]|nr:site-specific integrase [Planctomycetota bacterium]
MVAQRIPKYRRQKRKGKPDRAFVEIDGSRHYLGKYGDEVSKQRYERLMAEWLTSGRCLSVDTEEITITELCARFWTYVSEYYRKPDGSPTSEIASYRTAMRHVRALYGNTPASKFDPRALKAVRQKMIDRDNSRSHINKSISRIKRMFKWGVQEDLLPVSVHVSLQTVEGLKQGRSAARETTPVCSVPEEYVKAVEPYVSRQVWAIIQLQLLTGARPGELVMMRPIDLDMSGVVWIYKLSHHKTAHHNIKRTIPLGEQSQKVIEPFFGGCPVNQYLFAPKEAENDRRNDLRQKRVIPLSCGNIPGSNRVRHPKRVPGDYYTSTSYRRAIARACKEAEVPNWHPHQLRHNYATRIRRDFGLEAAQVMLGHQRADVTQIYAEVNTTRAIEIAAEVG